MNERPIKPRLPASSPRPPAKPLPPPSPPVSLPDLPELTEDIPDEFRPLMKGLRSAPSARATPFRGIQLPTGSARTTAVSPDPAKPSPSGRTAPQTASPAKPPSSAGMVKPGSQKVSPVRPPSGAGYSAPKPVIMSNNPAPVLPISARSTPARGNLIPASVQAPPNASGRLSIPTGTVPASASSRPSQKMGWVCHRCHCKVDPQSIVKNEAIMVDGHPLCARCIREERSGTARKILSIVVLVALGAGTIGCFALFFKMSRNSSAEQKWIDQAKQVLAVAESGNLAEAEHRVSALISSVESGNCKDTEAISIAYRAEDTLKLRFKNLYGELSPKERDLLLFLLASYPGTAGRERVRAVHVGDDNAATVSIVFNRDSATDTNRTEVRALIANLLQRFPKMVSANVTIQYFNGDAPVDAGNLTLNRVNAFAPVKDGPQLNVHDHIAGPNPTSTDGAPIRMVNPIAPPIRAPSTAMSSSTPKAAPPPAGGGKAPQNSQQSQNPPRPQNPWGASPEMPDRPTIFNPQKAPVMQH